MNPHSVHACCVVIGAHGVLVRGGSGLGKSSLGDALVVQARMSGAFARHVADDRVLIEPRNGRLIARPPASLAGLWERRGQGIVSIVHEARAVIRLIVDLVPRDEMQRMPDPGAECAALDGIALPRITIPAPPANTDALRVLAMLEMPVLQACAGEQTGKR